VISPDATQTAVIVPIEAAEFAVAGHRRHLDVAASWGVPAHVSVLYPFVSPTQLDDDVIDRLGSALSSVPAFDCTFARCQWFDEDVVWLAPEPDQPFRALTTAAWRAFPDHPPYGGIFDDMVPHLTVGERRRGTVADLQHAERAVSRLLPITTRVEKVLLIAGTTAPDSWRTVQEFLLPAAARE
jgi:2'-5' RNA ligase